MSFRRIHQSKSQNSHTSSSASQFVPRSLPVQEPKRLSTQEDIETEAFQQNKFEALGLQLKEKYGTITPVEQEKLGVLQAKKDSFWGQRTEWAKAQPNSLEASIRNSQSAQFPEAKVSAEPNPIQAKGGTTSDRSESSVEQQSNKTGLLNTLKAGVERLSGYSLDNVRVHYNSPKPAQLQALAYTQGTEIHVAPGQEKHLPHEMWHVVQQAQGRVQPTHQFDGVDINNNEGLEREAEQMGELALASASAIGASPIQTMPFNSPPLERSRFARSIVQRVGGEKSGYDPDDIAKESFRTAVKELFDLARQVNRIRKKLATKKNETKLKSLSESEKGKQVKGAYAEDIIAINLDANWLSTMLTKPDVIKAILKDALAESIIPSGEDATVEKKITELNEKISVNLDSEEILDKTWTSKEGGSQPVAKILTGGDLYVIKTRKDEGSGVFRDIYKKLGKSDDEHNEYVLDDFEKRTRRFAYMEKGYYQWMSFKEKGFLTGKTQNLIGTTLGISSDAIDPTDFNSQFLTKDEKAITEKLVTPADTPENRENRKIALAYMHQWKGSGPGQRGLSLASTDKENAIFGNAGESFRTEDGAKFKVDLAKTNPADNILINHYSVDSGTRSKLDQGDKDTANRILGEQGKGGKKGKKGKVYQYERSVLKNREIFLRNLKPEAVVSITLHTADMQIDRDAPLFNAQKKAAIDSSEASKGAKEGIARKAKLEQDLAEAERVRSEAQESMNKANTNKENAKERREKCDPKASRKTWRDDLEMYMTNYRYWDYCFSYWSDQVTKQTELIKQAEVDIARLTVEILECDSQIDYFKSLIKTKPDGPNEHAKRGWATGELYWQGYEAGLQMVKGKKLTTKQAIEEIFNRAYEEGAKKAEAEKKGDTTYTEKYDAYWEGYGNALRTALVT